MSTDSPRYILDTNIFISAKNGPYGFDIVPSFWRWLDRAAAEGRLYSSVFVAEELTKGHDQLAEWARERRSSGFFVDPTDAVQAAFGQVVTRVLALYSAHVAQPFLDGADPWLIAQAMVDGSKLVSFEALVSPKKALVKIPNICQHFDVRPVNTYTMLRECGAKL